MSLTNVHAWSRILSELQDHFQHRHYFSEDEIAKVNNIWQNLILGKSDINPDIFPGFSLIPERLRFRMHCENESDQFALLAVLCASFYTTRRDDVSETKQGICLQSLHDLFENTLPEIKRATATRLASEERLKNKRTQMNLDRAFKSEQLKREREAAAEQLVAALNRKRKLDEEQRHETERQGREKIKLAFLHFERGLRVHWQKSDSEIAELIGEASILGEITSLRKELARAWLELHQFRPPTDEQLEFIIDSHHSIRVTARAGSGKTETIATKILFLLHFVGLASHHILSLVFNVEARDDLIQRITDLEKSAGLYSKGPYSIMNFDRLARGVVQPQANILKGQELSSKIQELVHFFLSKDCGYSALIQQFMLTSFQADWNNWLLNNDRYTSEQLDQLRSCLMEEAIDGTTIKSKGEKRIADFFYEHDIDYKYEYPWRADRGVIIYPDFYLPQFNLVIEYLGLDGDKDYDESSEFKRRYWETKPGYKLVEILPRHLCGLSPDFLQGREEDYLAIKVLIEEALAEQGCGDNQLRRLSDEELLDKLKKRIRFEFEKLLTTSLTRLGQCCRSNADVISMVNSYQTSDVAERHFVDLLPAIDQAYRDILTQNHAIDFSQLKWQCIDQLEQGTVSFTVEKGSVRVYPDRILYIFIDEFQDFSELYQSIVQALLRLASDAVVNAVGDDWQMINRFAGSDLSLFHGFSKSFPRPRELTLTTNFRSSRQVVEFCNAVMQGQGAPARVADHLKDTKGRVAEVDLSKLRLTDAEEHYFKSDPTISSLLRLIPACTSGLNFKEILTNAKTSDQESEGIKPFFYILTHTNFPRGLKVGADDFSFIKKAKGRGLGFLDTFLINVYQKELLPTGVRALTAHRSKGKEAEVVFLLAPEQFPLIHPTSSFLGIFGDDLGTIIDDERRLFYVACSRARQWLFLLTFAPAKQPDYLPRHLLEPYNWDEAPYDRRIPAGLYKIEITNQTGERNALYHNMQSLKERHGFSYTNENGIPIRWLQLEGDLPNVSRYLAELVGEFRGSKLQLTLFDAAGGLCFQWPGPVEPDVYHEYCLKSNASMKVSQAIKQKHLGNEDQLYIEPLCRSIYDYFVDANNGLQLFKPQISFELLNAGLVVAQAELAWPPQKSAIVLSAEDYELFSDNGWRVWLAASESEDQSDHQALTDLASLLLHLRSVTPYVKPVNTILPLISPEFNLVHESCKSALETISRHVRARPLIGYELLVSGEGIIAQAELAWPDRKCAIVIDFDDYDQFQDHGWDVWLANSPLSTAIEGYLLLDTDSLIACLTANSNR